MTLLAALTSLSAEQQPGAQHGYFYVSGHYAGADANEVMTGQMYVEFLRSADEYQEAQRNIRAIANKIGVKIHGTQQPQQG